MNTVEALAEAFLDARAKGAACDVSSLPIPADTAEALETQALIVSRLGGTIAGWKIGLRPDEVVSTPLLQQFVMKSGGSFAWSPTLWSGHETEIAFRLARDLPPPAKPYTMDDIRDAVGAVLIGTEVVQSRIVNFTKAPFRLVVSDNIANGAYAVGDETTNWRGLDLSNLRCRVLKDGVVIHDASGGHGNGDPMSPLLAYANAQSSKSGGLKAGQFVTTGSVSGMPAIDGPARYEASIEGLGSVTLNVTR